MGELYALDPLLYPQYDDMLHKESQFIEHFYRLVTQSVKPPFAISIDGVWGTGKTTVMQLLRSKLRGRDGGYPVFWFNPWEYRQTKNVVLAFLQCLAAEHTDIVDKIETSGRKIFHTLLNIGIEETLKAITKGILPVDIDKIKEELQSVEQRQKTSYQKYENTIKIIKNEFVALIDGISEKHGNKPVYIFFDDLDRCLPGDAIQLLEALKNLFVIPKCRVIFICGIDTRVAKNFISKHYSNMEETFAINYFRKIFNLTVSMPYYGSTEIHKLLLDYITQLYGWDKQPAGALAKMVSTRGLQAEMTSVRKYLNVIHNFYTFIQFNPTYQFDSNNDVVVHLLIVKEAWQPLYEELVKEAMKNRMAPLSELVKTLIREYNVREKQKLSSEQETFLHYYFESSENPFHGVRLGNDLLLKYPTLA